MRFAFGVQSGWVLDWLGGLILLGSLLSKSSLEIGIGSA
jgi:hypothetical protein